MSGTLTALHDEDGKLLGFAKVMWNRTEQRLHLEDLEKRAESLQRADQRNNTLISTLAHELRNPLATVANATALLELAAPSTPEVAFAAGMISRQIAFMCRMVDDLLEVDRAATGKIQLRRERIVLQDILRRAVETVRPNIDERTQTLQEIVPDVPIAVAGDLTRLQQVFVNLIGNAAKYTQYGGLIWVKATTEGEEAVVRVRDTGVGISPEVMPHVFDLFTQSEHSGKGLGIGLSVVREVVVLQGGRVQASSEGSGREANSPFDCLWHNEPAYCSSRNRCSVHGSPRMW